MFRTIIVFSARHARLVMLSVLGLLAIFGAASAQAGFAPAPGSWSDQVHTQVGCVPERAALDSGAGDYAEAGFIREAREKTIEVEIQAGGLIGTTMAVLFERTPEGRETIGSIPVVRIDPANGGEGKLVYRGEGIRLSIALTQPLTATGSREGVPYSARLRAAVDGRTITERMVCEIYE